MVDVRGKQSSSILSKASGFADGYDFTLNPYSGCAFACSYCYAAFFAPSEDLQAQWGQWVEVKENALDLLRKRRKRPLVDQTIYISSVTDPYQPVERRLELTRAILRELLEYHQARVVIQTRSPLVTRDLDLLGQFDYARVQMSITTDDDEIRRVFEPMCPSIAQRLAAIAEVQAAGIPTCITMAPLLPVRDAVAFGEALLATGVQKFAIQHFHPSNRRFAAGTGETARALLREQDWSEARYLEVKRVLMAMLPRLDEGKAGFLPVWP